MTLLIMTILVMYNLIKYSELLIKFFEKFFKFLLFILLTFSNTLTMGFTRHFNPDKVNNKANLSRFQSPFLWFSKTITINLLDIKNKKYYNFTTN